MSNPPRPFVFRCSNLDGQTFNPGDEFHFDLNVFDTRKPSLPEYIRAFEELGRAGLGPGRGTAEMTAVWQLKPEHVELASEPYEPFILSLLPSRTVRHVVLEFVTPTELKSSGSPSAHPDFGILFARIRDRVSMLRAMYGSGPLNITFRDFGERAAAVRMTRCDLKPVTAERRSSRTGQVHPLGGFTGIAEYAGELTPFLPYLQTAAWTGVGRQTVWGKGEIRILLAE